MKRALRILATIVLLAGIGIWAANGAHRGWTVNNIEHRATDPVTGITQSTWEKGFIPGWDFLAAAALAAGGLAGASLLFRSKKTRA
ncbi:MAG TPA: hypothetical protein VN765_08300 [Candidatus Acidoferrum sp.]|nr:hypothetical protein [Candidatus Acidoferrum sp.]